MSTAVEGIESAVRGFLVERFLIDESLGNDVDLFAAGIVDSFGLIDMVAFLETSFSISFGQAEFMSPHMATVTGIVTLVRGKVGSS